jgi:hypothetical protein
MFLIDAGEYSKYFRFLDSFDSPIYSMGGQATDHQQQETGDLPGTLVMDMVLAVGVLRSTQRGWCQTHTSSTVRNK